MLLCLSACNRQDFEEIKRIEQQTLIYDDTTNKLTLAEVLEDSIMIQFKNTPLNRGILQNTMWVKVIIPNDLHLRHEYIELARPKVYIDTVVEISQAQPISISLNRDINKNLIKINHETKVVLFKVSNLGMPASIFLKLHSDVASASGSITIDLVVLAILFISIVISVSIAVFLYGRSRNIFYLFYCTVLISYISYYIYDSGQGKLFLPEAQANLLGQIPNMLYISVLLPLFTTLGIPLLTRLKTWVYGLAIANLFIFVIALIFFKPEYGEYLGLSVVIGSWILIFLIVRSYRFWKSDGRRQLFILGFVWLLTMPTFKGFQNLGYTEGDFYESSFTFCILLELVTWTLFIVYEVGESQRKKLLLSTVTQRVQRSLNHELLLGQEKERNEIALKLQIDVSPQLKKSISYIEREPERSKFELDRTIENIRYLSRMYIAPNLEENELKTELLRFFSLIQNMLKVDIFLDYNLIGSNYTDYYLHLNIYRLTQEAINNSITHGKANSIIVQILGNPNFTIVHIEDNGTANLDNIKEGYGLKGIRSRLDDYDYKMNLSNDDNKGARLEIEIKKYRDE